MNLMRKINTFFYQGFDKSKEYACHFYFFIHPAVVCMQIFTVDWLLVESTWFEDSTLLKVTSRMSRAMG